MTEHDHNYLSTKGPGESARDPLAGLRSVVGAATDDTDAELRENDEIHGVTDEVAEQRLRRTGGETTYTVHVDRTGDVVTVTLSLTKLGIALWRERPMTPEAWEELTAMMRDG